MTAVASYAPVWSAAPRLAIAPARPGMPCPRCRHATLLERLRTGVLVDACPSCGGVWLDRGELERLLVQAAGRPRRRGPVVVPLRRHRSA